MSTTTLRQEVRNLEQSEQQPFVIRTIVAGLEFNETSRHALTFATALAHRLSATLHITHVFGGEDEFQPPVSAVQYFAEYQAKSRLVMEATKRTGYQVSPTQCHLRAGKPATELCALAREINADLVAVATEGRTRLQRLALGSTAEKVVRHSPCPVLVVRKGSRPWRIEPPEGLILEKILAPVDFSECAQAGALYASRFASRVGANLLLVHVVDPDDYMPEAGAIYGMSRSEFLEDKRREAEERLEMMMNHLPLMGIEADFRVLVGDPRDILEKQTRQAEVDMVITSTHGRTGLAHVFLGSTAEYLVRTAECPTLVVPSHPR